MPTETISKNFNSGTMCQISPSSVQHATCMSCVKKSIICQSCLLQNNFRLGCKLRGALQMNNEYLTASTRNCFRNHSRSSPGKFFPSSSAQRQANSDKNYRLKFHSNRNAFFQRLNFFSQNNLLVFFYFFFALFFITISDAAPLTRGNLITPSSPEFDTNRTRLENVHTDRLNPLLLQETNPDFSSDLILEPLLDRLSPKVRRSSEVRKRSERRNHKGERRRKNNGKNKRRKNKKENTDNKKHKSKNNPYSQEIIDNHHVNQNNLGHNASPRRQRLYNKNGVSFHLAVWRNGTVSGEKSDTRSRYSMLEIRGISKGGIVSIMGVQTRKYICVSRKGAVKAKKRFNSKRCRFEEKILPNHQNTYESLSCSECFLNLRKNGRVRRLKKTNPRLTQAHFLPRLSRSKRLQAKQGETVTITFSVDASEARNASVSSNEVAKTDQDHDENLPVSEIAKNVPHKSKDNSEKGSKHLKKLKRRLNAKRTKIRSKTKSSKKLRNDE